MAGSDTGERGERFVAILDQRVAAAAVYRHLVEAGVAERNMRCKIRPHPAPRGEGIGILFLFTCRRRAGDEGKSYSDSTMPTIKLTLAVKSFMNQVKRISIIQYEYFARPVTT